MCWFVIMFPLITNKGTRGYNGMIPVDSTHPFHNICTVTMNCFPEVLRDLEFRVRQLKVLSEVLEFLDCDRFVV